MKAGTNHEPHVIQSRPSALLLRALDNLHTLDIRTEDLDGHLNSNASELVPQEERSLNSAQLDAQDDSVERIAVLEDHPHNVTGLDTARIPSVVEQSLSLALRVELGQL